MRDTLIKILFHRVLTHNMTEGHRRMTPTVQWRTTCKAKQLVQTTKHRVHKHLPPIQMLLIIKFSFRTPRDMYPVQLVPLANVTTDIHSLPTRGPGKKASSHTNTQPSVSDIFAQTSAYPQSRNLGTGHPKLFCTACGEYGPLEEGLPL